MCFSIGQTKNLPIFPGVPMDIFVIRESVVVPYLQDAYFDNQLPVLPPHVDLVSLTWQAKDDDVSRKSYINIF